MKTFLTIVGLLFSISPSFSQGWQWQNPLPQGNALRDVDFADSLNGTAIGDAGTILHTSDGGQTWIPQQSGTTEDLYSISVSDASTAHAVGSNGTILRTTDAGETWIQQSTPSSGTLRSVDFTDPNTGTVVEDAGGILRTNDGGQTWTRITIPGTTGLFGVHFRDRFKGTAVGFGGRILRTNNGGVTWTQQNSGTAQTLYGVYFLTSEIGVAVGTGGTILRTTNGGDSWAPLSIGTFQPLFGVSFLDSLCGIAVGMPGTNYRTTNGGASWDAVQSGTTNFLWKTSFPTPRHGYAVGNNGTIMYSSNGGINWVEQSSGTTTSLFSVNFTDALRGTSVGDAGLVIRTTNGGSSWVQQSSGTTRTLWSVEFHDGNTGIAVGNAGEVIRTTNGGSTWLTGVSGTSVQLLAVSMGSQSTAIAVGSNGTVVKTTNGGASWTGQTSGTSVGLTAVDMIDANTAIAVGSQGTILRTDDGGNEWFPLPSGTSTALNGVSFSDQYTGTVVGMNGLILRTTNGGVNWSVQSSGISTNLNSVRFLSSSLGFAVGFGGVILRTNDGGGSWTLQNSGTNNSLVSVTFADYNKGWSVGSGGTILHTATGGIPPAPAFSAGTAALDFGSVVIGQTKLDSVVVTNSGSATLQVTQVSSSSSRFSVSPSNGMIAPSATKTFYVTFTPVSAGSKDASVVFITNTPGSPDTVIVSGVGSTDGLARYLTVTPEILISKDPTNGKLYKPVRRNRRQMPNWANLISEVVIQGGFQPGASEGDVAGGMVVGVSHMIPSGFNKWKPNPDSSALRCWVRLTRWSFSRNAGVGYTILQRTLEDRTGIHTGPARGFDATGVPGDPNRRALVKQQLKLFPRKHSNKLFAELLALKVNIAASQLGKIPVGFGELIFDVDGNLCDDLSVREIGAKGDHMMTYWQQYSQAQFDSLYSAISVINRAFNGPLDTLSFEADEELVLDGAVTLAEVPFLKPGTEPPIRLAPTTRLTELEEESEFEDGEFEEGTAGPVAKLYQNYPNPFNPSTTVSFRLQESAHVTLRIFNVLGQEVRTLASNEYLEEGFHVVEFDARDLSSGVYLYQLVIDGETSGMLILPVGRMVLVK